MAVLCLLPTTFDLTQAQSSDISPRNLPVKVATWNVNHFTSGSEALPTLRTLKKADVEILFLQEVKLNRGILQVLNRLGYKVRHARPEFAIAWDPHRFEYISGHPVVMSEKDYWLDRNKALVVVLRDRRSHDRLKLISYHPPAHVQVPSHPTHDEVMPVLRDADRKWDKIARRTKFPTLGCGDINVDYNKGWAPPDDWEFLRDPPYNVHIAPEPTHGNRRIDECRDDGFYRAGKGRVLPRGPSDHHPVIYPFAYRQGGYARAP